MRDVYAPPTVTVPLNGGGNSASHERPSKELCNRPDVGRFVTERTAQGKLGIKSGGGIFTYTPEGAKALAARRARKLVAVRKALEAEE